MASLPDIDTSQVSFLAFWNAIDQGGATDIDPTEATNYSGVTSQTLYDNGVEGTVELSAQIGTGDIVWRDAQFRVKEDGWFVVYIDRSADYSLKDDPDRSLTSVANVAQAMKGPWDVVSGWPTTAFNDTDNASLSPDALAQAIQSLQNELSNSGSITFNFSDTGLYNYEHPNATTTTLFSALSQGDGSVTDLDHLYTSGTTNYLHVPFGHGPSGNGASFTYNGFTLFSFGGSKTEGRAVDAQAENIEGIAGSTINAGFSSGPNGGCRANLLAVWG